MPVLLPLLLLLLLLLLRTSEMEFVLVPGWVSRAVGAMENEARARAPGVVWLGLSVCLSARRAIRHDGGSFLSGMTRCGSGRVRLVGGRDFPPPPPLPPIAV
jgi:hypothetical protein